MVAQEDACPLCGCALGLFAPFERDRHVNDCLDGSQREAVTAVETCPSCEKKLGHLGERARERHVLRCAGVDEGRPRRKEGNRRKGRDAEKLRSTAEQDTALERFLGELGLRRYVQVFTREKVDIATLRLLTEEELGALRIPPASRRRIVEALPRLAMASVCKGSSEANRGDEKDECEVLVLTQELAESEVQHRHPDRIGQGLWMSSRLAGGSSMERHDNDVGGLDELLRNEGGSPAGDGSDELKVDGPTARQSTEAQSTTAAHVNLVQSDDEVNSRGEGGSRADEFRKGEVVQPGDVGEDGPVLPAGGGEVGSGCGQEGPSAPKVAPRSLDDEDVREQDEGRAKTGGAEPVCKRRASTVDLVTPEGHRRHRASDGGEQNLAAEAKTVESDGAGTESPQVDRVGCTDKGRVDDRSGMRPCAVASHHDVERARCSTWKTGRPRREASRQGTTTGSGREVAASQGPAASQESVEPSEVSSAEARELSQAHGG
mmetsp:Transcript_5033/g.15080  ORF Transcript_5033/g.15080 Transcript_5033/m.15080 type:complete len:490 (+) Transcript_5033:132-1601(+)